MRRHRNARRHTPAGKPNLRRRVALICTLIAGIVLSGLAGMQSADAVGISAAGSAAAVGPGQVIALILLIVLFFATAGLVGLFWHHLSDSQGPRRRQR